MSEDDAFLLAFAFIPARYGTDLAVSGSFPGGFGADIWTFFSYAFIHADLMHLGFNLAWLIPFGTALARRFGAWRYSLFMLVMAAAGALAHLVSNLGAMEPMIGASAAISGAMAAAMRFVFQERGPLGVFRNAADEGYHAPAAPLSKTLRDPRFLLLRRGLARAECAVRARHHFVRPGGGTTNRLAGACRRAFRRTVPLSVHSILVVSRGRKSIPSRAADGLPSW